MVHVPAKFGENTSIHFWVTVRKLNVTDRQTDRRGALQYLPSRAFGAAGDNKGTHTWAEQFEEYKHNTIYLQGTGNTSNYSVMCWDTMTHHEE